MAMTSLSQAILINFGNSWPEYTVANYAADPYNRVLGLGAGNGYSTTTQIANLLNGIASTTFTPAEIFKLGDPVDPELNGPDGQFAVPGGWDYLIAQYDGPNGGSVVINLGGNSALVPYDSSLLWADGDKYAVSHWSVAGRTPGGEPGTQSTVPDGGSTVAMLGLGLLALGFFQKKK